MSQKGPQFENLDKQISLAEGVQQADQQLISTIANPFDKGQLGSNLLEGGKLAEHTAHEGQRLVDHSVQQSWIQAQAQINEDYLNTTKQIDSLVPTAENPDISPQIKQLYDDFDQRSQKKASDFQSTTLYKLNKENYTGHINHTINNSKDHINTLSKAKARDEAIFKLKYVGASDRKINVDMSQRITSLKDNPTAQAEIQQQLTDRIQQQAQQTFNLVSSTKNADGTPTFNASQRAEMVNNTLSENIFADISFTKNPVAVKNAWLAKDEDGVPLLIQNKDLTPAHYEIIKKTLFDKVSHNVTQTALLSEDLGEWRFGYNNTPINPQTIKNNPDLTDSDKDKLLKGWTERNKTKDDNSDLLVDMRPLVGGTTKGQISEGIVEGKIKLNNINPNAAQKKYNELIDERDNPDTRYEFFEKLKGPTTGNYSNDPLFIFQMMNNNNLPIMPRGSDIEPMIDLTKNKQTGKIEFNDMQKLTTDLAGLNMSSPAVQKQMIAIKDTNQKDLLDKVLKNKNDARNVRDALINPHLHGLVKPQDRNYDRPTEVMLSLSAKEIPINEDYIKKAEEITKKDAWDEDKNKNSKLYEGNVNKYKASDDGKNIKNSNHPLASQIEELSAKGKIKDILPKLHIADLPGIKVTFLNAAKTTSYINTKNQLQDSVYRLNPYAKPNEKISLEQDLSLLNKKMGSLINQKGMIPSRKYADPKTNTTKNISVNSDWLDFQMTQNGKKENEMIFSYLDDNNQRKPVQYKGNDLYFSFPVNENEEIDTAAVKNKEIEIIEKNGAYYATFVNHVDNKEKVHFSNPSKEQYEPNIPKFKDKDVAMGHQKKDIRAAKKAGKEDNKYKGQGGLMGNYDE